MARISQDQVQERQSFLLELFRTQPDISRNEAMESYKDKFGASLNAKTFNELREQAQREPGGTDERADERSNEHGDERSDERGDEAEPENESGAGPRAEDNPGRMRLVASSEPLSLTQAQAAAKKPKPKGAGASAKNVFVDASHEQLQFLERVVHQLQEAGANNLRIDYGTERWMVLTVESK